MEGKREERETEKERKEREIIPLNFIFFELNKQEGFSVDHFILTIWQHNKLCFYFLKLYLHTVKNTDLKYIRLNKLYILSSH
jgi:hypothetical protein